MNERILIVEDEAIVLLDIRSRLAGLGYTVVGTASTGEEAVVKANATRPDAILMDIGLKGDIDGISAAETIRKTQDTPIIYLTANSDITTLQRAKITGPFGYVLKPFDERELRVTIEMALYKHRMDRDLYDARQWLKVTLKNIGDGVITSDEAGAVKFMNTSAEALTGWEFNDAQSQAVQTVFKIETADGIACLVNKEGRRTPIEYRLVPIEDDWGKVIGTVAIFKDISDRVHDMTAHKQAEKKLAAAENQICAMLEISGDTIVILDDKNGVICANRAAEDLSGLPAGEIIGKSWQELAVLMGFNPQASGSLVQKATELNAPVAEEMTLNSDCCDGLKTVDMKVIPIKSGDYSRAMIVLKPKGQA